MSLFFILMMMLGMVLCSSPDPNCNVPGMCIDSPLIDALDDSTVNSCLQDCKNALDCQWFSWDQRVDKCLLFENCTQLTTEGCETCISGKILKHYLGNW